MDSIVPYIYAKNVIPWKGKTLAQITSAIKKNHADTRNDIHTNIYFKAQPLSIYRKEIASSAITTCNYRTSSKINDFEMPNGSINMPTTEKYNGLVNTLDFKLSLDKYIPTCLNQDNIQCSSSSSNNNNCLSQENNARRRVRSSGMIRKKYTEDGTNAVVYCTNTNQYLTSRSKTFEKKSI